VVDDLDKTYKNLIEKGFTFIAPPVTYKPEWVPFTVKEAILIGPNHVPIAHIEILATPTPKMRGAYGGIPDVSLVVQDMDKALRFYRDALGLSLMGVHTLPRGQVNRVLGLPQGTDLRMAFLKGDTKGPVVELLSYSLKGRPLAPVAKPPNLGLFMISFRIDDLSGVVEKFKYENRAILAGPTELEEGPHGNIHAITVEGPDGEMIELFEIINGE
jgi:catechol 2,3-dioxygenase-like lactoylglutathione lyase family enzyme